jgi:hypothetical protein
LKFLINAQKYHNLKAKEVSMENEPSKDELLKVWCDKCMKNKDKFNEEFKCSFCKKKIKYSSLPNRILRYPAPKTCGPCIKLTAELESKKTKKK